MRFKGCALTPHPAPTGTLSEAVSRHITPQITHFPTWATVTTKRYT